MVETSEDKHPKGGSGEDGMLSRANLENVKSQTEKGMRLVKHAEANCAITK